MNRTARTVLLSTALLTAACTRETTTLVPDTPAKPAASQPPKTETPAAPVVSKAPDPAAAPAAPAPSVADLGKLLGGIKDGETAKAAKGQLDAIAQQLQTTKNAVPAAASPSALGDLGKMAGDAAAKLGVSPDVIKQIAALLADPSVKAAIGPTLEKLQGLLQ
ncbi:MAG TPA: hypothetical protein VFZ65_19700 [Planctomycetota bacterium]|nr:hypothetical protein [Planctomycetota bacterium]